MAPIKDLNMTYEAINEDNTFSQGDTIVGTVSFRLTKDVKVRRLFVKATGEAYINCDYEDDKPYRDHRRYFMFKEYLVPENVKGTSLPKGVHTFKFMLKIPEGDMPSSFLGKLGKIVYTVGAKVYMSQQKSSKIQTEINFLSKSFLQSGQCPQSGSVSKKTSGRSKGNIQMSATINRNVCSPGETLSVVAKICNSSSKEDIRPKVKLQQRTVYCWKAHTKTSENTLCKMVGDTISPNSEQTALCQLKIPDDATPTLHNCEIISVEYYIKVYLDISFATDPEVVFPLVIVPSRFATIQLGEAVGSYPPGTVGATSFRDFSPPAFPTGFDPVTTGSGARQYPTPDATQHANITSGNYNQLPQGATPYGFSTPALTSPSVQQPGPTAPAQFQQEEQPPSYLSLYPHKNE